MIRSWAVGVLAGVMGAISATGLLTSTSGDLEALVAWDLPNGLQIPGLIVIGLLLGLALRDLGRNALAYGLTCILGASIHTTLYALPGFDTANYTAGRLNNGLTTSLFVLVFAGIFVLVGQGLAFGINAYGRNLHD